MLGEGRGLSSRPTQDVVRDLEIGQPSNSEKCSETADGVKQIPVPLAELHNLEFRITSDHRFAKVGLWSRSHNTLMWRSPQFLRADIIRVWPPRKKKSAAVSGVILLHLQTIMTPAAPLTRAEAQRRCLAEVPDAYPGAFKKAWAILDPSCKRGRGQRDGSTR